MLQAKTNNFVRICVLWIPFKLDFARILLT
jgi:hypothetical protein